MSKQGDGIRKVSTSDDKSAVDPGLSTLVIDNFIGKVDSKGNYSGSGVAHFRSGNVYKGSFERGFMHGNGNYSWNSSSTVYDGDIVCNKLTGSGKYLWSDGKSFDGSLVEGIRHGLGILYDIDGCVLYDGNWLDGKRDGKGTQYYDKIGGSKYVGEWKKNRRSGFGRMNYSNGNVYEGHWENDKRVGQGDMMWRDQNQKYSGHWCNDLQDGYGVHTFNDTPSSKSVVTLMQLQMCHTYRGEWKDGKKNGYGIFHYANSSLYAGYWSNDVKHGDGIFISEKGTCHQGFFENDRFPKCSASEAATLTQQNDRKGSPLVVDIQLVDHSLYSYLQFEDIQKCMLASIKDLLNIFAHYSRRSASSDQHAGDVFVMRTKDLIEFLDALRALSPHTVVSMDDVKVILSRIERNQQLFMWHSVSNSKSAGKYFSEIIADRPADLNRPILLREFFQFLVRYSDALYESTCPLPARNEVAAAQLLAKKFQRFMNDYGAGIQSLVAAASDVEAFTAENESIPDSKGKSDEGELRHLVDALYYQMMRKYERDFNADSDSTARASSIVQLLSSSNIVPTKIQLCKVLEVIGTSLGLAGSMESIPAGTRESLALCMLSHRTINPRQLFAALKYVHCEVKKAANHQEALSDALSASIYSFEPFVKVLIESMEESSH